MQEDSSFGQWLKRRRKALDLTQAALARAVPCAIQTIRALEADELRPSRELAARLALALGLPTSDHAVVVAFARGQSDAAPAGVLPARVRDSLPTPHTRTSDNSPLDLAVAHTRPSGTVTFLFTDIAGSTALWEHEPQAMRPALARHDQILHACIAAANGYVYKMIGDAFQAAFVTAAHALAAALAAQRALQTEAWETSRPLRVRMALHTGVAEEQPDDYGGPLLNRVARLMAAGHGG
jgi:transcriptional regulator with XRE-family HTH domain